MRRSAFLLASSLLALAAPVSAQQSGRTTVEGDVYLVMQSGDVRRGAGRTVRLLQGAPVDSAIVGRCPPAIRTSDSLARIADSTEQVWIHSGYGPGAAAVADSARATGSRAEIARDYLTRETAAAMRAILTRSIIAEAPAGVSAHYVFRGVRTGRYYLWAEMEIGDNFYQWLAPLAIRPGAARATLDLDNESAGRGRAYCGLKVYPSWFR